MIYCECSSGVEHHLAKVRVEGSNPFTRSNGFLSLGGGIGRHVGLKIQWTVMSVRVQVPPWVLKAETFVSAFFISYLRQFK